MPKDVHQVKTLLWHIFCESDCVGKMDNTACAQWTQGCDALPTLQATSLPRERVKDFQNEAQRYIAGVPQAWDRYGARAAVEGIGSQVRNMSVQQQANG